MILSAFAWIRSISCKKKKKKKKLEINQNEMFHSDNLWIKLKDFRFPFASRSNFRAD